MAKGIKTGGRSKGTANIVTSEIRQVLKGIIHNELELISEMLEKMEPEKRAEIVLKLLPFVLPKVESVHMGKGEPIETDWLLQ